MTRLVLGIGMTSVQAAKPTYAYGSKIAQVPIKSGDALALLRATIPSSIPKNAVVSSAKIWVNQFEGPWTGSVTLTVLRHLAKYDYKVTWANKPDATTTDSQTRSNAADDSWWSINVTPDVQGFISGTLTNWGWRLVTNSSTLRHIRSQEAAGSQPYLEIIYTVPSKVPFNLSPQGGAVSVAKPVVTFTTGDDTTAINVQIDQAADAVSPDFDSGEFPATAGVMNLALPTPGGTYPGLADGATTYWRARAKSGSGWSGWSPWVSFSRANLPSGSLIAPTTTPADGSPPFLWSFAGTQDAWQATLSDDSGKVISDSGVVSGADTGWTPPRGLMANGAHGIARVRMWDDVLRVATPGAPTYTEVSVDFTVTLSGAITPMSTLVATQVPMSPGIVLSGTRTTGGIPDEVIVFRDGVQIARFPGTDIFTSSTAFTWTDWSAPIGVESTYRLAPVVGGSVASGGPTDEATPECQGIWLIDPSTGTKAVLWDRDEGSWDRPDVATVHVPVSAGASIVRRRLRRGILAGSISGRVLDVVGIDAADTLAALEEFAENDAGVEYQLITGAMNERVIVGDIVVAPTPVTGAQKAQFNFWSI